MSVFELALALRLVVATASREPAIPDEPALPLIGVPASLARQSATLEPSGLVWVPKLNRYLVVSDDTGPAHSHHQPWVLAMSRDGVFDAEPVPVLALDELNDAESICAGPDGLFFLVTSHSPNKRGLNKKARGMLLLLALEGRALRVLGRLDLKTARDADGSGSLLSLAGLRTDGRLDIEAITYRDGALLLGLKSPLSDRDRAVVLALANPVAALRAGSLPPGAVTRRWELALHGAAGGVPEGLADFTTLPDGRMAVLANSPKGRTKDGGGSLYWFHPDTGAVTFVRQWIGFHPEGVTLAADGRALSIVFDANTAPPRWTRWPLPPLGAP